MFIYGRPWILIALPHHFSYGGMLSAYMRFKYPNIITGAIAASAPIFMLDPSFNRSFFFSLVTLVSGWLGIKLQLTYLL